MNPLHKLVVAVLSLSFFVFIALFGRIPAFRNTPIGFLHRLLCLHTPRALHRADTRLTGGKLSKNTARFGHYLMFERHPLVLIFFLSLLTSASATFLWKAWPQLPRHHHAIIPFVLATPYVATYLCASSTASRITRQDHGRHLRAYPYDHTLYHPRTACATCAFAKPARSKHCGACGACVARADHHCAWVNNCVGRDNYRWFLLLVASLGAMLPYAVHLALLLLAPLVPGPPADEPDTLRAAALRWAAVVGRDPVLGGIGLLAALTAPLAWGLLAYHLHLIWSGMTTNETGKWAALRDAAAAGRAWRAARSAVLGPPGLDGVFAVAGDAKKQKPKWAPPPLTPLFERDEEDALDSGSDADSVHGGGSETAAARAATASWPIASDQLVVRTRDGKSPVLPGAGRIGRGGGATGTGPWEQVWHLEQVENLYDLGFCGNLSEMLFPAEIDGLD